MDEDRKMFAGVASLILAFFWVPLFFEGVAQWIPHVWLWRIGLGAVVLGLGGLRIWAQVRRDIVPDYLTQLARHSFETGGVRFVPDMAKDGDKAVVTVLFQNRWDSACRVKLSAAPALGFWLGRPNVPGIRMEFDCEPAAFGFARCEYPVPEQLQGKAVRFEMGGAAVHRTRRRKLLRFRNGLSVGLFRSGSPPPLGTEVADAALSFFAPVSTGARGLWDVDLPVGVRSEPEPTADLQVRTLWRLGDPPALSASDLLARAVDAEEPSAGAV